MRFSLVICCIFLIAGSCFATTVVDIPLDSQINVGLGNAITEHSGFGSDADGGYVIKNLTVGNGAGGYYYGPRVDLVNAGYGPYVDMSVPGTTIHYTARYFQGSGNTNPYGDAPIFMQLIDLNGRTGGLDISYGPVPNPTYPSWITCTDDTATNPTDAGFDISKVAAIRFYGTDWSGTGSDFVQIKNLKVINPTVYHPVPISETKTYAEGQDIQISGVTSAVFSADGQFYLQDPLRSCGVQVRSSTQPAVGAQVYVAGQVHTDAATGEMYVQASEWTPYGTAAVKPVGLSGRALGGSTQGRQQGVYQGEGLSNVGLLVKLYGKVTGKTTDSSSVYISDGSGLSDGGGYAGVRLDLSALPSSSRPAINIGDKIAATGVSWIYAAADGHHYRGIRVRDNADLYNLTDDGNRPKVIRFIVINFDPICPSYGKKRTHEVLGWNDPHTLVNGYIDDLKNCSGNWCQYQMVGWYDANYHAVFQDGFQYGADEFISAWNNRSTTTWHSGNADYVRICTDKTYPHNQPNSIAERIAAGEFDEVFMLGAPYASAFWEAAMAGPSPFFVNGGTYYVPSAGKNFVLMGFNYERGVDCMLEDFCHRTECVMSRVYKPADWWFPTWPITNNWDRFRMFDQIHPGSAACGITHYAPNSTTDYDWGNTTYVYSTCDDWLFNWPNLKGDITKRLVNCSEWGYGNMRLHHIWWLNHLPKAPGINPDGKQNNWWKYSCDFNSYPESW